MTITHTELGDQVDGVPPGLPDLAFLDDSIARAAVLGRHRRAEQEQDADTARLLRWELGIMDLQIPPPAGQPLYQGEQFARYAAFYGFTDATRAYALERADETMSITLRIHHLEYALLTMEPRGRDWIALRRRLALAYREYVGERLRGLPSGSDGTAVVQTSDAVRRAIDLASQPGVLRNDELREWSIWLVSTAQFLRDFDWAEEDYNRPHRWPFEILQHLARIRPEHIGEQERESALRLLAEAYDFFSGQPLADTFTTSVAEVEHSLRSHFGEKGTHEVMVRRAQEALRRKAELFDQARSALVAQSLFRDARKVVEQHRQYFDEQDVTELAQRERDAIEAAVAGGEFKAVRGVINMDLDQVAFTKATAEETVATLVEEALELVPEVAEMCASVEELRERTPLASSIARTVIDGSKVVREALSDTERVEADVDGEIELYAHLVGTAISHTIDQAAETVGLRADHVLSALRELPIDDGAADMLRHGLERYIAGDFVSALHILVPHFEDTFRTVLRSLSFDTTTFRVVSAESGSTRTDDTTLGALLRVTSASGRTVEDVLGSGLWRYVNVTMTSPGGLNLRNKVGHGLTRPSDCASANVGIVVHLLLCLVRVVRREHTSTGATTL